MQILEVIKQNLIFPLSSFKIKYMPIVIIYFCYGFTTLLVVGQNFWIKNELNLTALEVIHISFWSSAPYTMKILFSQFIENINIAGNRRNSYIIIGSVLMFAGYMILIAVANKMQWVNCLGSAYNQLLLSQVTIWVGLAIQDIVADTLCAELVDNNLSDNQIKEEIGNIQIIARISLMLAVLISTSLGGYLSQHTSFAYLTWYSLLIPIVSASAGIFSRIKLTEYDSKFVPKVAFTGLAIVILSISSELFSVTYNQEIIFVVNMVLIIMLFKNVCRHHSYQNKRELILIGIMVFASRINPQLSPAIEWWQIDMLGFDAKFFTILNQTNYLLGFVGTWLFASHLVKMDISKVIVIITVIKSLLFLPIVGMGFGLHEWTMQFGLGARTITLVDTVVEGPFDVVAMVPLLALATYYAPKYNKPTWFALVACFISMALLAGNLCDKILNKIYIIERGDYHHMGRMLLVVFLVNLLLPLIAVTICNRLRVKHSHNSYNF